MSFRALSKVVALCISSFLTACSGGAGGGMTGEEPTTAVPSLAAELVGTWKNMTVYGELYIKFDSDGQCVLQDGINYPCTYSVTMTEPGSLPSPSRSWIVQLGAKQFSDSIEIVALNAVQFTERQGDELRNYARVADLDTRSCIGTPTACEGIDAATCNSVGGCERVFACVGAEGCQGLGGYDCALHPGCGPGDACGAIDQKACAERTATECESRAGCSIED